MSLRNEHYIKNNILTPLNETITNQINPTFEFSTTRECWLLKSKGIPTLFTVLFIDPPLRFLFWKPSGSRQQNMLTILFLYETFYFQNAINNTQK